MRISDWSSDVCSSDLQMGAQLDLPRHDGADGTRHQGVQPPRQLALGLCREALIEPARHHKAQHPVAQKLQPLIVRLAMAGMGEGVEEQVLIREAMVQRRFRPFQQRSEEHTSELQSLMRISYAV